MKQTETRPLLRPETLRRRPELRSDATVWFRFEEAQLRLTQGDRNPIN